MKYRVEEEIPCFTIDTENNIVIMGLLRQIKKIDSIDYRLYYDYVVIMDPYYKKIIFSRDFEKIQSYNHLESMDFGDIEHQAIKYIFGEEI